MGGKVCLRCKAKHCWALSTNFWKQKVCWQHPAMTTLIIFPQKNGQVCQRFHDVFRVREASKPHWTYWLQILSKLCFQRVVLSGNYEIVAISTDKNTFFNDLDYKADIGQHFHKSEKSARRRHRHKIIKTNLKTLVSPLLTRPQGSQGCQKMGQDPLNMPV